MKKILWMYDYSDDYLIDPDDIELFAGVSDNAFLIRNVDTEKVNTHRLAEEMYLYEEQNEDFSHSDVDDMQTFFESIGFGDAIVEYVPDLMERVNMLGYDPNNSEFFNFLECDEIKTYSWWDGSNYKTIELYEEAEEVVLEVGEDYVDLDEWDGNNFYTGARNEHKKVYKILEIDGQSVEGSYLLVESSDYQGDHPSGVIMDIDALEVQLTNLGRDVDEYMNKIKALEG